MRVLIADDHELVRVALKLLLGKIEPDLTLFECDDYPGALVLAEQNQEIDLVILDLNMPGMNGISGVETFRSRFPSIPIVVISGYYRHRDIVAAFDCGVAGFVPKTLSGEGMVNAFRLVLSGEKYLPADLLSDDSPNLNKQAARDAGRDDLLQQLSAREREVLNEVLEGLTSKEIGRALEIQEGTVKQHLRSVYRKIGARNRAQAVNIALSSE